MFTNDELQQIRRPLEESKPVDHRRGGIRDVLAPVAQRISVESHPAVLSIVSAVLGDGAFIVRATLFDNTPMANWKVPWHQDVTIAVKGRQDAEGYGPWSVKAGVVHVQPPQSVLEKMITVRLHLDPCPTTNGALKVQRGSHWLGKLNQNDVACHIVADRTVSCAADAGDVLVMRLWFYMPLRNLWSPQIVA